LLLFPDVVQVTRFDFDVDLSRLDDLLQDFCILTGQVIGFAYFSITTGYLTESKLLTLGFVFKLVFLPLDLLLPRVNFDLVQHI
jgi:hypothetical protein